MTTLKTRLAKFNRMLMATLKAMVSDRTDILKRMAILITFPVLLPLTFVAVVICGL